MLKMLKMFFEDILNIEIDSKYKKECCYYFFLIINKNHNKQYLYIKVFNSLYLNFYFSFSQTFNCDKKRNRLK